MKGSARRFARTWWAPRLVGTGVGIAVGLGFRRVLFELFLRLLDRWMRAWCVRFRCIAVGIRIRIDRRFDIHALAIICPGVRGLDRILIRWLVGLCSHVVHPFVQVANSYWALAIAMPSRDVLSLPCCLRRFYNRSVVYCNPDCNSCRDKTCAWLRRRVRVWLARRLRVTTRRASGHWVRSALP